MRTEWDWFVPDGPAIKTVDISNRTVVVLESDRPLPQEAVLRMTQIWREYVGCKCVVLDRGLKLVGALQDA